MRKEISLANQEFAKMIPTDHSVKNWLDKAAVIILVFGLISLFILIGLTIYHSIIEPPTDYASKYKITLETIPNNQSPKDSVLLVVSTANTIDSINNMLQLWENEANGIRELIDRRDYIDYQNSLYLKLVGGFTAILLSIVGFFGYRSINEIRTSAEKISKETAESTAKTTAETAFESESANLVGEHMKDYLNSEENVFLKKTKMLEDEVKKCTDEIDNIRIKLTQLSENQDKTDIDYDTHESIGGDDDSQEEYKKDNGDRGISFSDDSK